MTSLLWTALFLGVGITTIPGTFTVDEPNHLVSLVSLRQGALALSATAGMPDSPELWFFFPGAPPGGAGTPVRSNLPPLWAALALPFSFLGISGLFWMNVLSYVLTGLLVQRWAQAAGCDRIGTLAAVAAFLGGGFALEYAQALWPHMVSCALVTAGAFLLLGRPELPLSAKRAAGAGLLLGLSVGVRYQNVVYAAALVPAMVVIGRRWRSFAGFLSGVSIPIFAIAAINAVRHDSWNPISKGPGYLSVRAPVADGGRLVEVFWAFWARVFDYSARPPASYYRFDLVPEPISGAYVIAGAVKKAWIQSSPWVLLVLVALLLAWLPGHETFPGKRLHRPLSVVIVAILGLFAFFGFGRIDGICFNQRYFFELTPLAALVLGCEASRRRLPPRSLLIGIVVTLATGTPLILLVADPLRFSLLLYVPLLLAAALILFWRLERRGASLIAFGLGAALAWGAVVHLVDDLPVARAMRARNARVHRMLDDLLPDRLGLVVWAGNTRNGAACLLLDHDLVLIEASRDDAMDAPELIRALLHENRPVFLVTDGFPQPVLRRVLGGLAARKISDGPWGVLELALPDRVPTARLEARSPSGEGSTSHADEPLARFTTRPKSRAFPFQ